jgi:hypothetical protein
MFDLPLFSQLLSPLWLISQLLSPLLLISQLLSPLLLISQLLSPLLLISQLLSPLMLISQLLSPLILLPRLFLGIGVIVRPCTLRRKSSICTVKHFQVNDLFLMKRCLGKLKMRRVFVLIDGVPNMEMKSDK